MPASIRAAAESMLGHVPSSEEWAGLVGARAGDRVSVKASRLVYGRQNREDWIINLGLVAKQGGYTEGGYAASRSIQRDESGKTYIYNAKFYVDESQQGKGIGSGVLARQAETAHRLGISYLLTNPMNDRADATWRKLGYYDATEDYGDPVLRFDTAPGSRSRETLARYQASRAARSR